MVAPESWQQPPQLARAKKTVKSPLAKEALEVRPFDDTLRTSKLSGIM